MQRVITGIIHYLINLDTHVYAYHKYSDTLNIFQHAMPFNKAKVVFKGSVLLSNAKWDTVIPSKVLISLLSIQFCIIYGTCSRNCTGNF